MSCARVVCTGHVANTRAEWFPWSAVVGCMSSLSYEPQRQAPDTDRSAPGGAPVPGVKIRPVAVRDVVVAWCLVEAEIQSDAGSRYEGPCIVLRAREFASVFAPLAPRAAALGPSETSVVGVRTWNRPMNRSSWLSG